MSPDEERELREMHARTERDLYARIEDNRAQAAALPRGSADRDFLVAHTKALEDFYERFRRGEITIDPEELRRAEVSCAYARELIHHMEKGDRAAAEETRNRYRQRYPWIDQYLE
jgi:hypothetical protein